MVVEYFLVFLRLVEFVFDFIDCNVFNWVFVEVFKMFSLFEVNYVVLLSDLCVFICMFVVIINMLIFILRCLE